MKAIECGVVGGERVGGGQMELGLRGAEVGVGVGVGRGRRPVRGRRHVAARWWFAQMRETVRVAPEWVGGGEGGGVGED